MSMKQRWSELKQIPQMRQELEQLRSQLKEKEGATVSIRFTEHELARIVNSLKLAAEMHRKDGSNLVRVHARVYDDLARKIDDEYVRHVSGLSQQLGLAKAAVDQASGQWQAKYVRLNKRGKPYKRGPYKKRQLAVDVIPKTPRHPLKGKKYKGAALQAIRDGIKLRWERYYQKYPERRPGAAPAVQPPVQQAAS
jgi:hypothetical protein